MKRVAVIMGGTSSERDVSLRSGAAVVDGLKAAGYDARPVVLERDGLEGLPEGTEAVFIALHGGYGENGGVQADLDRLGVPYTGPGAAASRITIDKIATKRVLEQAGVPTAPYEVLTCGMSETALPLPVVVKPPRDGSSVGITKVSDATAWPAALAAARAVDGQGEVLVETYIPGREWTVGVLAGEALPVVEIQAPKGWYGFQEKYTQGVTRYVFPQAEADRPLVAACQVLALVAFEAVGCRGVSRVDFRVTPDGRPYVLEINTVPGFTATSLLPKAAAQAGLSFSALCARLLESAACG
ncbi:MAG: D-alanine--D-alanine ligase [Kiritimatiellia bacterium]|jgi:D-alanine-D-alanine ligase|nr:D-alanine--D-alanine ligase [Kiritimatiellia bacterium]MDD4173476.1 D-alanine--D-alanine ligase [Kiritimatiellia bacterium]MDD4441344.1 D-alanine--D-alanine ligase [Kiritimatiellia bacterium]MDX9793176.1 D-alanine--D-alanine ligase [Kiritimatiellia bacterium]NLC83079.1 D-alanine--D-alanine ligase [Lentisphaerota bacterium]